MPGEKQTEKIFNRIWNNMDALRLIVLSVFFVIVIFSSWMCDDAYHGFVMAKHLVEGNGFVYNIGERVNAATNPLFILIIALVDAVSDSMYISATVVSVLFSSLAAIILLFKFCETRMQLAECFIFLCTCRSFVTYTTSGLENCLLFLLAVLMMLVILKNEEYGTKQLLILALVMSAAAMTRLDNALIYAPVLVYIYLFKRKNVSFIKCVLVGFTGLLPFILWECFSLFYYGSLVPNTAYIKLNTGISTATYIERGLEYIGVTFINDILVILLPVIAVIICLHIKDNKYRMIAAGLIFYLLYLIRIGGDFMLGRHFTVIYFISVILVMHIQKEKGMLAMGQSRRYALTGSLIMISFFSLMINQAYGKQFLWGESRVTKADIADERDFYYPKTSLFSNFDGFTKYHDMLIKYTWSTDEINIIKKEEKKRALLSWAPGIIVYYNSDIYLQDPFGLGDPLLSRLPSAKEPEDSFRVGHMHRDIPKGYRESIENNDNEIVDPSLHKYYDKIRIVVCGEDLWDKNRLKTIIDFNLGKYDYLIDEYKKIQ
ncbi:MAG: hypothetical protein J6P45_02365 [Lachnospiraceae bacterium]|nr:hypothetical protein [Lachnospiraceae bacterium]